MQTHTIIKIRGYHIDQFGHVNHCRYLEFLEEGRWSYMEDNHLMDLFHATGIIHVVIRITVDFKYSAKAGDTIRIETGLIKVGRSSFTMGQTIYLDTVGIQILEAGVTNVFIDKESRKAVVPDSNFVNGWTDLAEFTKKERKNG